MNAWISALRKTTEVQDGRGLLCLLSKEQHAFNKLREKKILHKVAKM